MQRRIGKKYRTEPISIYLTRKGEGRFDCELYKHKKKIIFYSNIFKKNYHNIYWPKTNNMVTNPPLL